MSKKTNIYVLELEHGKFYVGRSNNVAKRVTQHKGGDGCAYTHKYPVIKVKEIISDQSVFEEDRVVKEYMALYGIDNVRGGSYVQEFLSQEQKNLLQREIRMAQDLCLKCGRNTHFVQDCHAQMDVNGNPIEQKRKTNSCQRCGRNSHSADRCFAKTHQDGSSLEIKPQPPPVKSIRPAAPETSRISFFSGIRSFFWSTVESLYGEM